MGEESYGDLDVKGRWEVSGGAMRGERDVRGLFNLSLAQAEEQAVTRYLCWRLSSRRGSLDISLRSIPALSTFEQNLGSCRELHILLIT